MRRSTASSLAPRDQHGLDQGPRVDGTDAHQTGEAMTDIQLQVPPCDFRAGDNVVYSNHGAGVVLKNETRELFGEKRAYLTIQFLHSSMIALIPCQNAQTAGLRRPVDREEAEKVIGVLTGEAAEMPKSWTRRLKLNREKIRTGDVYELAEVIRNLASREWEQGLSAGEKDLFTRAKRNLASEFMYAFDKGEHAAESYLDQLLEQRFKTRPAGAIQTPAPVLPLPPHAETDGSASQGE
jgi:CarD family transcriptional regulator, regulator of rRNA transcription